MVRLIHTRLYIGLALGSFFGAAPVFAPTAAGSGRTNAIRPLMPAPVTPLSMRAFKKLLEDYQFIADFEQKPSRPASADKRFYRYPIPLKSPVFKLRPLTATKAELERYFTATRGEGRDIEHINLGRNQLRNGRYEQAWHTFMGAKERYGLSSPFHRRIDYMLGYAFINKALELKRQHPEVDTLAHLPPPALRKKKAEKIMGLPDDPEGKVDQKGAEKEEEAGHKEEGKPDDGHGGGHGEGGEEGAKPEAEAKPDFTLRYDTDLKNASTFLSWAYINKVDEPDPLVDMAGPPSYYNLAVIYTMRGKWGEAYNAAYNGVNFLQRYHDKSYRPELRRIMAEAFLQNRTYWEAVSQLDFALRQDPDISQAAKIFGRAGDIYFDLNNFYVAADVYDLAIRVNQLASQVDPNHYVLRGEALFWLGKAKEAQIMFQYALSSQYQPQVSTPLRQDLENLASIRMADTALILGKTARAKQAYFEHADSHRGTASATHARLRLICLELPKAQKRNIHHYHDFLKDHKQPLPAGSETFLPPELIELAHTCETDSFYRHKNGDELLAIIRSYARTYPKAKALMGYKPKIAAVQRSKIEDYFAAGDTVGAAAFFEQNRATLFAKVPKNVAKRLFFAYVGMHNSQKAAEFYRPAYLKTSDPKKLLAVAMFLAETSSHRQPARTRKARAEDRRQAARALAQAEPTAAFEAGPLTIVRLLTGKGREANGLWLLHHALKSAEGKPQLFCQRVLPLLGKLPKSQYRDDPRLRRELRAAVTAAMAKPGSCFASTLALEASLNQHRPVGYSELLLSRKKLPVTAETRQLMFTLAGRLSDQSPAKGKRKATARKLWQWVSQNGEQVQKQLADLRLNPAKTQTVTESLWQPPK